MKGGDVCPECGLLGFDPFGETCIVCHGDGRFYNSTGPRRKATRAQIMAIQRISLRHPEWAAACATPIGNLTDPPDGDDDQRDPPRHIFEWLTLEEASTVIDSAPKYVRPTPPVPPNYPVGTLVGITPPLPTVPASDYPDVPEGRYMLRDGGKEFLYRVTRPVYRAVYAQFASVPTGGSRPHWRLIHHQNVGAVLAGIKAFGIQQASALYGQTVGVCGVCGRALTDPESVRLGIGPVCIVNRGWAL